MNELYERVIWSLWILELMGSYDREEVMQRKIKLLTGIFCELEETPRQSLGLSTLSFALSWKAIRKARKMIKNGNKQKDFDAILSANKELDSIITWQYKSLVPACIRSL
jgi:hypothetical protein